MRIGLIDTNEFVEINRLDPITSPVLFQRGEKPHPDGLLSLEIFGMTPKERRETFAYIDLGQYFFQPHVYKIIKRFFRNIENIVDGTEYYVIDSKGHLIKTDDILTGGTGIEFLYNNWEKIKWEYTDSPARNERIDVVTKSKKSEIFLEKEITIPAFYRDVTSSGSGGSTQEINTLYSKLIRMSSTLKDRDTLGFPLYHSQLLIQNLLVNIYDYFKDKLEAKTGLLRKYLMGKNTDFSTRTVITSPVFHASKPEELQVNFRYSGIPIPQILSLCQPFVMKYVKEFFERELFSEKDSKSIINPSTGALVTRAELDNPERIFTDKFIKKKMDAFIKNPDSRFDPIEVPLKNGKKTYMVFHGRRYSASSKDELASISTRKMTWTDLFFMASYDAVENKHCLVTRYPILDQYGIFVSRITVLSTSRTEPMQVGEKIYKWYPVIEPELPRNRIAAKFIDSVQFSNSFLPGLDGD